MVNGKKTSKVSVVNRIRKAGRNFLLFVRVIFKGTGVPAYISCGISTVKLILERLLFPKTPEMLMKLKSMETMI